LGKVAELKVTYLLPNLTYPPSVDRANLLLVARVVSKTAQELAAAMSLERQ
jgi:hypothetical protein